MGFHPTNFGLLRPFRSRVRSREAADRRTDRKTDTASHPVDIEGIITGNRIALQFAPVLIVDCVHVNHFYSRKYSDTCDPYSVCVCVAGIDSSVHFQSFHQNSYSSTSSGGGGGVVSVDDVYHGTKAALSAGNTTVGQSSRLYTSSALPPPTKSRHPCLTVWRIS